MGRTGLKAALLFSGGVDSTCLAAIWRPHLTIFIDYGQVSAEGEARAARAVSKRMGLELKMVEVDCSSIGSGQLSGKVEARYAPVPEWWPYRNQLLLTLAAPLAIRNEISALMIGTVATDRVHKDGRPEFVAAIDQLFRLQEGSIRVLAPGLYKTTSQLILESGLSASMLAWTHSCHIASFACGRCRGCEKRGAVLQEAGIYRE